MVDTIRLSHHAAGRSGRTLTVDALLARHDLTAPDGRLLHAYDVTDAEFAAMTEVLQPDGRLQWGPRIFVLWAAEEIRRNHSVGGLTWDFLLDRLGQRVQRGTGLEMVSDGLAFWHRPIRRRPSDGKRLYLYSLMAEGGLPDAFLSRDSGYASAVLGAIGDIERGVVAPGDLAALDRIAAHRGDALPAAFQSRETRELLRDLAMACVELRRALPDALGLEAALLWLDRSRPGWAERLPLRLSPKAREAILLPALSRQIERPSGGALAQRLLLPTDGGRAWAGALRILRGGLMPFGLLPKVDRALTLRLVASNGATLRASPDHGGWRLEAPRDVVIALEPWAPGILIAYADGVALGEVVVDPGLHEPGEFAQLWRLESPLAPHALIPAAGGRSRGERLWLLAAGPPVCSPGIICHVPLPGPGGQVWPLSGQGQLQMGMLTLSLATQAQEDSPTARILVLADTAREGRVKGGLPAFTGVPRFLGARGDLPMQDVTAQIRVTKGRGLAVRRFDWIDEGEVVASTRAVILPQGLSVALREVPEGLEVAVRHLPEGWLLAVQLGLGRHVMPQGGQQMTISPVPADLGEVGLDFFDADGRSLGLLKPWPARAPILIDPQGQRLTVARQISLHGLLGWRGVLPQKGSVELRMPKAAHSVAFGDSGLVRLAAWRPLLAQVQALSGADGLIELGLITDRSSPKLRLSRHDWHTERKGAHFLLGDGPVELHASTTHAPVLKRRITASGAFDPTGWLGDEPHLWFVQGRSAQGVMRPFPWSAMPVRHSTRNQRIDAYLVTMTQMMAEASHPGWEHLTEVMDAARAGGDCGSLDQAQALGVAPDVAVALLFRADPADIGAVLELETEAPLWWPAVPVSAWAKGIGAGLTQIATGLAAAGFDDATIRSLATNHVARVAGVLRALRPELSGHLGLGMLAHGLAPLALAPDGRPQPLAAPRNPDRLKDAARQLAARSPCIPQGAATLRLCRLTPPSDMFEGLRPLLIAPLVLAEVALGLRPALTATETLDLLALRHVDPQWFDTALPLGLSLA